VYMNKLRTNFDLPTNHLKNAKVYVPPKARSSSERDRRHDLPKGSLILEQQYLGTQIAEYLLGSVEEPEDISFVTKILAAAGMNTSWYNYGQTDSVMRRCLKLPMLTFGFNERPESQADLLLKAGYHLGEMGRMAEYLATAHALSDPKIAKIRKEMGRTAGNASLSINCIGLADQLPGATPRVAQEMARVSCLVALQGAKVLSPDAGYAPSFAQLPDPDSDLAVHIRRDAPNNVFAAYDEAVSMFAVQR
jgi:hypothetical protein